MKPKKHKNIAAKIEVKLIVINLLFFTGLYRDSEITLPERNAIFKGTKKLKTVIKHWTTFGRNQQNTSENMLESLNRRFA